MSPELIGILSLGMGLGGLMVCLFAWLRKDIRRLDDRVAGQGERLAHIEGLLEERGRARTAEALAAGD